MREKIISNNANIWPNSISHVSAHSPTMGVITLSTHVQALLVDADHHPGVLTLHTEADAQSALVLLGLSALPGPVVQGGG